VELDGTLRLIHEPARLKVMALLYQRGDVAAAAAREALGLTPGNLDAHVRRLEGAGLARGVGGRADPGGGESIQDPGHAAGGAGVRGLPRLAGGVRRGGAAPGGRG
jgi:DNA-binding transcriptional ArsR family regulator